MTILALIVALGLSLAAGIFYTSLVFSFDRYEKEPRLLVGAVFIWGAIVAIIGSIIFELLVGVGIEVFFGTGLLNELISGSFSAPFAEEITKSMGVLLVFLLFREEFDSILDGIIYASVVALGFAATENFFYLLSAYSTSGWSGLWTLFGLRVIIGAWAHPFYTSAFGIGLAIARMNRNLFVKIFAPLSGLAIGMLFHGLGNGILTLGGDLVALGAVTLIDWLGWLVIIIIAIIALVYESRWQAIYLKDEVDANRLTRQQYLSSISIFKRFGSEVQSLFHGKRRATIRLHQVCGELAHKKRQFEKLGQEKRNTTLIEELQSELEVLSKQAQY